MSGYLYNSTGATITGNTILMTGIPKPVNYEYCLATETNGKTVQPLVLETDGKLKLNDTSSIPAGAYLIFATTYVIA